MARDLRHLLKQFSEKRQALTLRQKNVAGSLAELNQAMRLIGAQIEAEIWEMSLSLDELEELRDTIADEAQDAFADQTDDYKQSGAGRQHRRWVKAWRDADASIRLSLELPEAVKVDGMDDVQDLMDLSVDPPA